MVFALAAFLGCDVFDSASYAKFASRDSLMFTWGTKNLDELEELPNEFSAFPGMTATKLKKLDKDKRQKIIAKHNLMVSFAEIRRIKQAIHDGLLWELVESRLRSSPALMKVFDVIENNIDWIAVADENYGEGSSREHAAMEPRFMGCKIIIAKSFARIAQTNLKKQGILPLIFKDKSDYDKIEANDTISTINLKDFDNKTNLKLRLNKPDGSSQIIETLHTFSKNQIEWFKAGSALNLIAKKSH